ncbi:hypothetical protein GJ688_13740 [Heliobacillus mobilis]|uniref:SHOCT domain-containing protein n=1 Tax=Heliobacterium mobile TaxID=28064 RepID=A0A6I3SM59_HELMO|nr:hypothetical protein [Heliobacterium mobile]MTV50034.1 hypothetical protein [Heliobacterium mobile]
MLEALNLSPLFITVMLLFMAIPFVIIVFSYKRYSSPHKIAARRYAKGEISFEEYQLIHKNLSHIRHEK